MKSIFRILTKIYAYHSTLFYFFPVIQYEDELLQKRKIKGKAIIASNHKKPLDFVFMKHIFFMNYLHCLVGEAIYDSSKIVKILLDLLGSVKVNRIATDMTFMEKSLNILENDGIIEIYPEGKLPFTNQLLPFYNSAVYMAILSGAKVIPVYHDGNYGIFKRVKIIIGKPLYFHPENDKTPTQEYLDKCTKELESKVRELKYILEGTSLDEKTTIQP